MNKTGIDTGGGLSISSLIPKTKVQFGKSPFIFLFLLFFYILAKSYKIFIVQSTSMKPIVVKIHE